MPGGATGPARRQGTHHPPPNQLADETDSTTDEEPCRPRRPGVNGDRRVPHTRRSLNSAQQRSLRSPLTLRLLGLTRSDVVSTDRAAMYLPGGCHTPAGRSTQRSSGLSGRHSRSNCQEESRPIAVSEVAGRTRIGRRSRSRSVWSAVREHALTGACTIDPLRMTATIRVSVIIGIVRRRRAIALIATAATTGTSHRDCWQVSGCGKCEATGEFGSQRLVTKYCSTGLAR